MTGNDDYLKTMQKKYWQAKRRAKKSSLLDEFCLTTGKSRKYAIRMMSMKDGGSRPKKKRQTVYDAQLVTALMEVWVLFSYPCGQCLKPLLDSELEWLRENGELNITDEIADKLKRISPATIDRKLRQEKMRLSSEGKKPSRKNLPKRARQVEYVEWGTPEEPIPSPTHDSVSRKKTAAGSENRSRL